jgi:hypothetical protein
MGTVRNTPTCCAILALWHVGLPAVKPDMADQPQPAGGGVARGCSWGLLLLLRRIRIRRPLLAFLPGYQIQ